MKILIITPSYKPAYVYGGPIFSVGYLAENVGKTNDVLVLSTTANGKEELELKTNEIQLVDGVAVRYFKRQTKDHTHFSIGLLYYLWKHGSMFDVIHIQSWWNLVALFSACICRIKGWKYIVTPRGMLSPYTYQTSIVKKWIHFFIGNSVLKKALIHATAPDEALKLKSLNEKYVVKILPNYVNTDIPLLKRQTQDVFQLLFLSRIHPKKGLDVLIKSLGLLEFRCHLHIVGDGDERYVKSLMELARQLQVEDKITWHGSLYDTKKYDLYAHSDLMLLPSHDENFANNVLESLLLGTPVIVSENVGLADFVKNNSLGWVFRGSEKELASAISNAYKSKEVRERINLEARERVLKEFDNAKLTQQYLSMYKNV